MSTPLWKPGNIAIWAFHHILEQKDFDDRLVLIPEVEMSADTLETLLIEFKAAQGQFLSMDELLTHKPEPNIPYAVVTLDDGYLNNRDVALPIFEKHQVPACIYVTTGYPDKTAIDLWNTLAAFIDSNPQISFTLNEKKSVWQIDTREQKRYALCKLYNLMEAHAKTAKQRDQFFENLDGFNDGDLVRGFSWQDLKSLVTHPLITIGGHTVSHPSLVELSDDELLSEISDSKHKLEQQLNTPIAHFAYPFGHRGEREQLACSQVGFQTATSISPGFIDKPWTLNAFDIPRLYLDSHLNVGNPGARVLTSIQQVLDNPIDLTADHMEVAQ